MSDDEGGINSSFQSQPLLNRGVGEALQEYMVPFLHRKSLNDKTSLINAQYLVSGGINAVDFLIDSTSGFIKPLHQYLPDSEMKRVAPVVDEKEKSHRDKESKLRGKTLKLEKDMQEKRSSTITEKDKRRMGKAEDWVDIINYRNEKKDELLKAPFRIGKRCYGHRDNVFSTYETRVLCSKRGSHTPTQPGISGHFGVPSDSIVAMAMGGYGDEDYGDVFIYTGQGGSNTEDQTLNRYNISLVESHKRRVPVRLVRGYQLDSAYAPSSGYRYDGLYWVTDYWLEPQRLKNGSLGACVYRYRMIRLEGQPPISKVKKKNFKPKGHSRPSRAEYIFINDLRKGRLGGHDYFVLKILDQGFSDNHWENAYTLTKIIDVISNVNQMAQAFGNLSYLYHPVKSNGCAKIASQWNETVQYSALPIMTTQTIEKTSDSLGLKALYEYFVVPISPEDYQSGFGFEFAARKAQEKPITLTFMCKKKKRPNYVPYAYCFNENNIISTSCFYTSFDRDSLSRYLTTMPVHGYVDTEDYEQFMIDERTRIRSELDEDSLQVLKERKTSNYNRLRGALNKL